MDEYKPTRKELAYIADVNDGSLANWLNRDLVSLSDKQPGRWTRFALFDAVKISLVNELAKYMSVPLAHGMVACMLETKSVTADGRFEEIRRVTVARGKIKFELPNELTDEEQADFIAALMDHRWVIQCKLEQRGANLEPIYSPRLYRLDENIEDVERNSYIVINFRFILDGVLARWKEVIDRRTTK